MIKLSKYLFLNTVLLAGMSLTGCSTDFALLKEDSAKLQKVADIEKEPITRLSFIPTQGEYDDIEIIVLKEEPSQDGVEPAAGP